MIINPIAVIHTDFPDKFGIPRQSGLTSAQGVIEFASEYRNPDALRGIEEYDYLWILWGFSENRDNEWRPTVRPPRLGGNVRKGVFATRSPYRPNPIGMSCVKLVEIREEQGMGHVLIVEGIDMMDGTPIYDIKPYIPYADAKVNAAGGFAERKKDYRLDVMIPDDIYEKTEECDASKLQIIKELLAQDPRPSYQEDPERIYGMKYANLEVKFQVSDEKAIVREISKET